MAEAEGREEASSSVSEIEAKKRRSVPALSAWALCMCRLRYEFPPNTSPEIVLLEGEKNGCFRGYPI